MWIRSGKPEGRRGSALALVAVSLVGLSAMGAIAVDLGMLYKARGDAQRAAEAAALAGASAFVDFDSSDPQAEDSAAARARRYALANTILNRPVVDAEIQSVQVIPGSQMVRVIVGRSGTGTWFARLFGVGSVPVNARAAAAVTEGAGTNCVKPLMISDLWAEGPGPSSQDANGNRLPDDTPDWTFDQGQGDSYRPFDPAGRGPQTGYGSDYRNQSPDASGNAYPGDLGRQLVLDPQNPGNPVTPGNFGMWTFDDNEPAGGLTDRITNCDPREVQIGQDYKVASSPPPVAATLQDLIDQDTRAHWNSLSGQVEGSQSGDWRSSPRILKIALFSPQDGIQGSNVTFNNLALFFLESVGSPTNMNTITGRFLYYVPGNGSGEDPAGGSLIKALRLVE
jgi:hypothetical protein